MTRRPTARQSRLAGGRESGCAIVTGAAGGIGRAVCVALGQAGYAVVAADLADAATQEVAAGLVANGIPALGLAADLCEPGAAEEIIAASRIWYGAGPSVIVNSAGILQKTGSLTIGPEEWAAVISTNLGTVQAMVSAALPGLRQQGRASIVNIASISGQLAVPGLSAYTAAKHGVIGLTRALAVDLAAEGIRVNAVAPGMIETPMTQRYLDRPDLRREIEKAIPLGRVGQASDIADAVAFLASARASYITGCVLTVDGGFSVGKSYISQG